MKRRRKPPKARLDDVAVALHDVRVLLARLVEEMQAQRLHLLAMDQHVRDGTDLKDFPALPSMEYAKGILSKPPGKFLGLKELFRQIWIDRNRR